MLFKWRPETVGNTWFDRGWWVTKVNCMAIIVSICYANYNYKNNGDYGYHAYNRCNHQYSKIHPNPVLITTKPSLLEILKNIFSKMHKFFSNSVSYFSTSLSRVSRQVSVLFIWYSIFSWFILIWQTLWMNKLWWFFPSYVLRIHPYPQVQMLP